MKTDRIEHVGPNNSDGDVWRAECPDCGWWIVDYMNRPEYGGDELPQDQRRKLFTRRVQAEACMCVPHRFSVGQKFDNSDSPVMKIDRTHKPEHLWLTSRNLPKMGKQLLFGGGKRFLVVAHNEDGSFSVEEQTPLRGPRSQ